MRKFLFLLMIFMCNVVFASTEVIKDSQGNITAYKITIILTPEEYDVMATECDAADYKNPITGEYTTGIEAWIQNAVHNRARVAIDKIVEKSGEGSRFTPISKKLQIIRKLKKEKSPLLKGAKERMLEMKKRMLEGVK